MKKNIYKIYLTSIIITGLFCPVNSYSQESKILIDSCFYYLEHNSDSKFEAEFPQIFSAYCKEATPEYQDIIKNIEAENWAVAFSNLYKLIEQGSLVYEIKSEPQFIPLHTFTEWQDAMRKIDSLEISRYKDLKRELYDLQKTDQGIRLLLLASYKQYGIKSDMSLRVRRYMNLTDSVNSLRIQGIIDEYGWPGKDKLGEDGNETLFLCIQHSDDLVLQDKYLPILKEAVEKGDAEPWHYAFLVDRVLMNKGEEQIYGTQKILSENPENSYIVPLKYPDDVDQLRSEIGLEPLAESLEEDGMVWNLDDYKKKLPEIEKKYRERYKNK